MSSTFGSDASPCAMSRTHETVDHASISALSVSAPCASRPLNGSSRTISESTPSVQRMIRTNSKFYRHTHAQCAEDNPEFACIPGRELTCGSIHPFARTGLTHVVGPVVMRVVLSLAVVGGKTG